MLNKSKFLIFIICGLILIYFTGCPLLWIFTPDNDNNEREKPADVEKHHYDNRGIEKGKKDPERSEESQTPPPDLETKRPSIMSKYGRALELDKQGKFDQAYDMYREFVDEVPKIVDNEQLEDPNEKEKRRKAMEHAKKRMGELAKYKQQEQNK